MTYLMVSVFIVSSSPGNFGRMYASLSGLAEYKFSLASKWKSKRTVSLHETKTFYVYVYNICLLSYYK